MKAMRYISLVCLAAVLLCAAACGKAAPEPDPLPPPAPMAAAKAAPEPTPAPDIDFSGMTALEAYAAARGGDYGALAAGLDTETYGAVIYYVYGEALEEYRAEGEDIAARLYEALGHVIVTGPYEEDVYMADAGSYVGFTDRSGNDIGFTFDMGCLSVGGTLYEVTGDEALKAVRDEIREAYEQ